MKRLCFFFLIMVGCQGTQIAVPTIYKIEPSLQKYVDTFFAEAKARGLEIEKENLIVRANNVSALAETCASCQLNTKKPDEQRIIEVYTGSSLCWQIKPENDKETLIFHELGHCLLKRIDHRNDTFADGVPKSLMVANNTDLYGPCIYVFDDNTAACNKTARRKYYIDELFDPKTEKPSWAK